MPYFERKPYDETIGQAASAAAATSPADAPISDIARAVLSSEVERKHLMDGPFRCRQACRPGGAGSLTLIVSALDDAGPVEMRLEAGDLTNEQGGVLPAERLTVSPTRFRLAPGESVEVRVSLRVPDLAAPGRYQGRITGMGDERTEIVVVFDVTGDQA